VEFLTNRSTWNEAEAIFSVGDVPRETSRYTGFLRSHVPRGTIGAVFQLALKTRELQTAECSTCNFPLLEICSRPPLREIKSEHCSTWNLTTKRSLHRESIPLKCRQSVIIRLNVRSVPRGTNDRRGPSDFGCLRSRGDLTDLQARLLHLERPPEQFTSSAEKIMTASEIQRASTTLRSRNGSIFAI
jgi:hypothetical protein